MVILCSPYGQWKNQALKGWMLSKKGQMNCPEPFLFTEYEQSLRWLAHTWHLTFQLQDWDESHPCGLRPWTLTCTLLLLIGGNVFNGVRWHTLIETIFSCADLLWFLLIMELHALQLDSTVKRPLNRLPSRFAIAKRAIQNMGCSCYSYKLSIMYFVWYKGRVIHLLELSFYQVSFLLHFTLHCTGSSFF